MLREALQQMENAVHKVRDDAAILSLISRVQNRLLGKEAAGEMTDGMKLIDEFIERRERQNRPLSPDHMRLLMSVRKELEVAHAPPYPTFALRERLHHDFIHPLQREVMRNVHHIEQFENDYEMFHSRHLEFALRESMGAIAAALSDVPQPADD